ncbi:hypothetical protein BU15DRAFT_63470 [Melanogaster broomeanus]|nr:hypothetical protein BU15DRAFT_63470 [Melanogaster broomeanus]
MLPLSLARFLRHILKFLTSVSADGPICLLLRILALLRRWLFRQKTKPRRPAPDDCRVQFILPSINQDDSGVAICAMTDPSLESPEPRQHDGRPSSVDRPYDTSSPNPPVPYSPSPSRQYTRNRISSNSGSRTPFHEEFGPSDVESPEHDRRESPDSPAPTSVHRTIQFARSASQSPGRSVSQIRTPSPSGFPVSPPNNGATFDAPRSGSPVSIRPNSQTSTQLRSPSGVSMARASYRERLGPRPRSRTPTLGVDQASVRAPETGPPATPGCPIPSPNFNNLEQPGESINGSDTLRFAPCSASEVERYDRHEKSRKKRYPESRDIDCTIRAMSYEYPETHGSIGNGWTAQRHPEGILYFMHSESKAFTEANMRDEKTGADIEKMRNFLFSELRVEIENRELSESLNIDDVQLVLEPKEDPVGVLYCYYFVNPRNRSLFWLDDWEGKEIFVSFVSSIDILSPPRRVLRSA